MDSRLRIGLLVAALALGFYWFVLRKHDAPPGDTAHAVAPPASEQRGAPEQRIPIHSGPLAAMVSTYSGGLLDMKLTNEPYVDPKTHAPFPISSTWKEEAMPLRSDVVFERDGHNVMPTYLTFQEVSRTPTSVELVAQPPGTDVEVHRVIRAAAEYAFRVETRVVNHGAPGRLRYAQSIYHWVKRNEESGGFFRQSWQVSEGLCEHGDDRLIRAARADLSKPENSGATNAHMVGVGNLYFLNALVPQGTERTDCLLRSVDGYGVAGDEPTGSLLTATLAYPPVDLAQDQDHAYAATGYFGPKLHSALTNAAPVLHRTVDLGTFALIARGLLKLLQFLHSLVKNWGVAIALLTVIIRTALFPLLQRSVKSMAVMQKLKPEMDAINAKYADNVEQRGVATMELYRKHGMSPFSQLSGCLPQLAQLPVWWALYRTLQTSVELFHAPFVLWIHDLSAPDPIYALPLIMGGVIFLQQKMMPPAMPDPQQAKMMLYFMPIMLTGISLFLPAGLALYMLVNSILAMIQQRIVKGQVDRMSSGPPDGGGSQIEVRPAVAALGDGGSGRSGGRRGRR